MNTFKLALFNVRNNIRLYRFNVISMVTSIVVLLNFLTLIFNPSMNLTGSNQLLVKATLYMTSLILVFFICFFVLYANSFFLKQRKREIGIYTFMGVAHSKIAAVYAVEEIILGALSLVLGLLFGTLLQKAFFMLLTKIAGFETEVAFHLSGAAFVLTSAVFITVFIIAGLFGFISISKSKLIDLMNAEKHADKYFETRLIKAVLGILSIGMIAIGFSFGRSIFGELFIINTGIAIVCIISGTFLFFSSFLPLIILVLKTNKRILYNGTNIISISNIVYRIRYNYKILACITIIAAATIVSLGASLTVDYLFDKSVKIAYPYSFSYVGSDSNLNKEVLETIADSNHQILLDIKTNYLLYNSQKGLPSSKNYPVVKLSDFIRLVDNLNASNKEDILKEAAMLTDGQALSVPSSNDKGFKDNQLLNMYGLKIMVQKTVNTPLLGAEFVNNAIILTGNDYEAFKSCSTRLPTPENEHILNGIIVSDQAHSEKLVAKLADMPKLKNNLNSYITYYKDYCKVTGVVKFTGLFLGIVFMLSTASIMYMKLMSDAIGDRKSYEILSKLGLSNRELSKAVSKQVGLSYALPLAIGTAYAYMGILVLQGFLNNYFEISLSQPFLVSVGIYTLVYILFYILAKRKFVAFVKA